MMRLGNDPETAHAKRLMLTVCFHADVVAVFSLKQTDSHRVMRDSVRRSIFVLLVLLLCFLSLCSVRGSLSIEWLSARFIKVTVST